MDERDRMKQNIQMIIGDIESIGVVVRHTEHELSQVMTESPAQERLASMRSRLSEVHARLDGLKEFALRCERKMAGTESEEELDLWL